MQIEAQELQKRLQGPGAPLVVDVRQPEETAAEGFIAGALRIPMAELPVRLAELPEGREIVAVCKRGMRSLNAAGWLRQTGRSATSLAGGMDQWRAAGLPVSK